MLSKFNNKKHRRLTALLLCSIDAWQCNLCFRRHLCSRFRDRSSERSAELYRRDDGRSGFLWGTGGSDRSSGRDNYKETTKKIQTQEMLIFPGFSLCLLICGTPQKSINFLR